MLTPEALENRKWGEFPELRKALKVSQVPDDYYGHSSVSENLFNQLQRLAEVAVIVKEHRSVVERTAKPENLQELKADIFRLKDALNWASRFFSDHAEFCNRFAHELNSTRELDKLAALRAFARMMNHLSAEHFEPLLAEDFHYASQWVFEEITSKQAYLDYIRPKLETIRKSGSKVWAEIAELPDGPCVLVSQDSKDNLQATVLISTSENKIKRLDMCCVPPPQSARRTGEYPT